MYGFNELNICRTMRIHKMKHLRHATLVYLNREVHFNTIERNKTPLKDRIFIKILHSKYFSYTSPIRTGYNFGDGDCGVEVY